MHFWEGVERGSAWLDRWLDRVSGAAIALMVLLMFGLVAARYLFSIGSIAGQEAVQWLHALAFLLGASVALRADAHVRIDILQQRWSQRTRDVVELLGLLLLLLPFCVFVAWISLDYVAASWSVREASREPGGLPALYLLKTLIPVAAALLGLQALARVLAVLRRLRGKGSAQGGAETARSDVNPAS
ncbi:MAG: TRAP transporter small permease subunit [Lysobacteraceae bacterium]